MESAGFDVTDAAGQADGRIETGPDLGGGVGVGAEGDGQVVLVGEFEQWAAGVDFAAVFAEAARVEFDGHAAALGGGEEVAEQFWEVGFGVVPELLGEIEVAEDVEVAGLDCVGEALDIAAPDAIGVLVLPLGDHGWVVDGPVIGDVMDGADEVIPRVAGGQVLDPVVEVGQVIDFEGQADGQVGMIAAGLFNGGDVSIEVGLGHPPIVEVIARHRGVVGEPDFGEADLAGVGGVIGGGTDGMPAERRVQVIVGRQRHARE